MIAAELHSTPQCCTRRAEEPATADAPAVLSCAVDVEAPLVDRRRISMLHRAHALAKATAAWRCSAALRCRAALRDTVRPRIARMLPWLLERSSALAKSSLIIPGRGVKIALRVGECSSAPECSFASPCDAVLHSLVGSQRHRSRLESTPLVAPIAAFSRGSVGGVTRSATEAQVECSSAAGSLALQDS